MKKVFLISILIIVLFSFVGCNESEKEYSVKDVKNELVGYLESRIEEDGSFTYSINLDDTKALDDYNILRHSLSYYALLESYEEDETVLKSKKELIEKGIDFLLSNIVYKNENEAYVDSYNDEEITLRKL